MKKLLLLAILFVFTLSLNHSVFACSLAPRTVAIKCDIDDLLLQQNTNCLNDDCSVNVSKEQYGGLYLKYLNLRDSRYRIYIDERYESKFVICIDKKMLQFIHKHYNICYNI
jgi:hypothetical protein